VDGVPLEAVSIEDGTSAQVVPQVLRHADFLSACHQDVAVASGGGADLGQGTLMVAGPPDWKADPMRTAEQLGGPAIWPACTRDGDLVATSILTGELHPNSPLDRTWRLWIYVKEDPQLMRRLLVDDPGAGFSDEAPRWAHNGQYVMFVRRQVGTEHGQVYLLRFGPGFNAHEVSGPIADLGSVPDQQGYADWSGAFDWFQPWR
jgi:hypothetical protein